MNNAELYNKNNQHQRRDAIRYLEEYAQKIRSNASIEKVIDIGCGDGSVTSEILRKYLPKTIKVVGCDVSANMVKFANEHYADPLTTFIQLDIAKELPAHLKGQFNHAFSSYAFHWIRKQQSAFFNVYELLVEGGDCLLFFPGGAVVFDIYRILSKKRKWSRILCNVDQVISLYHDVQKPDEKVKEMMKTVGFRYIEVQRNDIYFVYDTVESLKNFIISVNPFHIPQALLDEYLDEFIEQLNEINAMDQNSTSTDPEFRIKHLIVVAYGSK